MLKLSSITGVEGGDFALVALPEVITLVLCVLRRCPAIFVGVIGVHFGAQYFTCVCLHKSGRLITGIKKRWMAPG